LNKKLRLEQPYIRKTLGTGKESILGAGIKTTVSIYKVILAGVQKTKIFYVFICGSN